MIFPAEPSTVILCPVAIRAVASGTLEQAAVLMQRCLKNKLTADEDASLPESAGAVSAWARGGVQWAYNAGLLREADLSAPAEAAGRVLLAQLLRRSAE